jgi:hypothetical protein
VDAGRSGAAECHRGAGCGFHGGSGTSIAMGTEGPPPRGRRDPCRTRPQLPRRQEHDFATVTTRAGLLPWC